MPGPRVSIGMPVWNRERYIRSGLDSLLGQTFGDFELIISDNASTDQTQAICEEYAERDRRVRYSRNGRNIGLQANFERVLQLASAPYFMWGCPDDLWDATYVAQMVAVLDGCESVVLAGSNGAAINKRDVVIGQFDNAAVFRPKGIVAKAHRFVSTPPGGGHATLFYGLMRTPIIQRVGYAPPGKIRDHNRGYYATDLLVLFRLMFEGDFHVVDETLYFHRDTHFDQRGSQRLVAVARAFREVHGYYGDLRSIIRESPLDDCAKSSLTRATLRGELRFHPLYARRLFARRMATIARGRAA